jgi:hypothetical protein
LVTKAFLKIDVRSESDRHMLSGLLASFL